MSDFVALTKPRVMLLAVFTAVVGLISARGQLDPLQALIAVLCIAAGAGAAGALNMWYDADIDAVMTRTAMRPIPRGRVSKVEALVFGVGPWRYRSRGSRSRDEPHSRRAVGRHHPLLCCRVHGVAEAGSRDRTSSSAVPPEHCRRSSDGPRQQEKSGSNLLRCFSSFSFGRRLISGPWRLIGLTTTHVQACRCCRLSLGGMPQRGRS